MYRPRFRFLLPMLSFIFHTLSLGLRTLPGKRVVGASRSMLRLKTTAISSSNGPYWKDGLSFGCTGCGRCCQTEGEVWMNADEIAQVVNELKLPASDVLNLYVDEVRDTWIQIKNNVVTTEKNQKQDQCIFLNKNGKTCSIYNSRPVQCLTYPYWSPILSDENEWKKEKVVPENEVGRKWTLEDGGCEGIEHKYAPLVSARHIFLNSCLYDTYLNDFSFTSSGEDKEKLLEKINIINSVTRTTKSWVKEFVIGYRLCPFAEKVFKENSVHYTVSTLNSEEDFEKKLKYEVLYLLAQKETVVATSLLILPFFKPDFKDFYRFSLYVEDELLPRILSEIEEEFLSSLSVDDERSLEEEPQVTGRENQKLNSNKQDEELQLAFFHPNFMWGHIAENPKDPLHFEKRSPFPTVNLLRASQIQAFADKLKTQKIAALNSSKLQSAGYEKLFLKFKKILESTLDQKD